MFHLVKAWEREGSVHEVNGSGIFSRGVSRPQDTGDNQRVKVLEGEPRSLRNTWGQGSLEEL